MLSKLVVFIIFSPLLPVIVYEKNAFGPVCHIMNVELLVMQFGHRVKIASQPSDCSWEVGPHWEKVMVDRWVSKTYDVNTGDRCFLFHSDSQ